ncbi:sensor histidine kinase [Streptomyces sp. NRRL S-813]|uniref:sensor histidine kinase n=1 Tax=Streptomyces sp. NRRL S-813 TaxID=1463919 RepID=UPI00099BB5BC|nr:ATP-binding protein [Streptomyces sp. NRRL S-813]
MTVHTDAASPRAERPSPRRTLRVLLTTVVVAAAVVVWATASAPASFRTPLAIGAGAAALALCAAVATAVHQREQAGRARRQAEAAATEAAASARAFADETVPALLERVRGGSAWETALAAVPQPADPAHQRALRRLAEEFGRSENRRAAALAACANVAGRMQALATGMLADLREMEHRHIDPDVLGDLLHLDHRTAQAGRLADSIAVLTGARSGRRWAKPIVMESVLRGAMGRIAGYQRVRLHSITDLAVAGYAAEGVMHALAEILDNACNFSPPTTEVHVYVSEVPAGVVITVEDSGLVMSDVALRRAEHSVGGASQDLAELSGTRLGLAVVGRLARKHGLTVSFRPSASGGTGVVVLLPQDLITRPQPDPEPEPARAPEAGRTPEPEVVPVPVSPLPARKTSAPPTPVALPSAKSHAPEHATAADPTGADPTTMDPTGADPTTAGPTATDPAAADPTTADPTATDPTAATPLGAGALPKRRRGRTLAAAHPEGVPGAERRPAPAVTPRPTSAASAHRLGAFRRAVTGQGPAVEAATGDPVDGRPSSTATASHSEDDR